MPGYVQPNLRIKTSVSLNYAAIFRYVGVTVRKQNPILYNWPVKTIYKV